MVVFVTVGLSSRLVEGLVRPIAESQAVRKVVVFRNTAGPSLPKTEYCVPPERLGHATLVILVWKAIALTLAAIRERPALIHGFLLVPHGLLAGLAGLLTARPFGVTLIAGPVEFYAPGQSPLGVDDSRPVPLPARPLLALCRKAALVGALNKATRDFAITHGVDAAKACVLVQPVDTNVFFPSCQETQYDAILVSRLAPIKHVETALKAAALLRKTRPRVRFAVVGDGPVLNELKRASADLGLELNVEFLGSRTDVPALLNRSRLFVQASEREGLPTALLEAMACGLPCVTSTCGIVPDICFDGENALVIDQYDDAAAFARAIDRLLGDDELRGRLGRAARETVVSLSWDRASAVWTRCLARLNRPEPPSEPC